MMKEVWDGSEPLQLARHPPCTSTGYGLKYRQGWVWCSLQLQYHQLLNISYVQTCYRHHEASWARLGSMTVSFEAVPHSPSCGVAQPQSSMKESHPAKLHLQEVDQTATASSTSNKSTSLQLLLLLHTTVATLRCAAETNAAAQLEHLAPANRRCNSGMQAGGGRATHMGEVAAAGGASAGGCIRRSRNLRPNPVGTVI